MIELTQVAIVFLLVLAFITLLSLIIGWKLDRLLKTLKEVIKLEFTSVPGRVSLVVNFLTAVLFLVIFMSHEAMALVKALVKPELEASALNLNFCIAIVALMFCGNLGVLAFLNKRDR